MNWLISIVVKALKKLLIEEQLTNVITLLNEIKLKEDLLMATIQELEMQIVKSVAVESAAVLLIQGFAARLDAAGVDPVKLEQLKNDLNLSTINLEAAVEANKPAGE